MKMTFSRRLHAAFAACTVIVLVLGLFAMFQMARLATHTRAITGIWMPAVQVLLTIKSEQREFRTQELQHILSTTPAEMDAWEGRMTATLERLDDLYARYEPLINSDAERSGYGKFRRQQAARLSAHERVRAFSRRGQAEDAIALARGEVAALREATAASLEKLVVINQRGAQAEGEAAEATRSESTILITGAILLAIGLSVGMAIVIVRGTMRRLGADPDITAQAVARIADGDLATPVPVRAGDRDSLMVRLADMRARLARTVRAISESSLEIRAASVEVARGNLDLSGRTEQQAASLQETASAMDRIAGTIARSADNARRADELAARVSATARDGGQTVDQVVRTMDRIADSSRQVQDIVGVIDGIAFQTNILALNAAVEAARAGESGRGFAVVAAEVRMLARRSADSAREIKALIARSAAEVDEGTRLASLAGASMTDVVGAVDAVAEVINEISGAAIEQSGGIGQVNQAVGQLDTVTQRNAALVEEATAATRSMEAQAERLGQAIAAFRIDAARAAAA